MTERKYLSDTELFESEGRILRVAEDERGRYAVLDSTIFYPQGGGQPSDRGVLTIGNDELAISFVAAVESEVRHYGELEKLTASMFPLEAKMRIDSSRRLTNARAHTAGHLIASLVEKKVPTLKGVKGFHFPEGPYVEFTGEISEGEAANLIPALNEALEEAIQEKTALTAAQVSDTHRTVTIGGFTPTPCGGTHVASLDRIGKVRATKMKRKSGQVRISYSLL